VLLFINHISIESDLLTITKYFGAETEHFLGFQRYLTNRGSFEFFSPLYFVNTVFTKDNFHSHRLFPDKRYEVCSVYSECALLSYDIK
jgi:hypothetical protein